MKVSEIEFLLQWVSQLTARSSLFFFYLKITTIYNFGKSRNSKSDKKKKQHIRSIFMWTVIFYTASIHCVPPQKIKTIIIKKKIKKK